MNVTLVKNVLSWHCGGSGNHFFFFKYCLLFTPNAFSYLSSASIFKLLSVSSVPFSRLSLFASISTQLIMLRIIAFPLSRCHRALQCNYFIQLSQRWNHTRIMSLIDLKRRRRIADGIYSSDLFEQCHRCGENGRPGHVRWTEVAAASFEREHEEWRLLLPV